MAVRDHRGRYSRKPSEAIGKKLDAIIERTMKTFVLALLRELRAATPVLTGHARANWIATIDAPNTAEAPEASQALYQAGVALVRAFTLNGRAPTMYVSNIVDYIGHLNDGWSEKAPALFVEGCIDRALVATREKTGQDLGRSAFQDSVGSEGAYGLAEAYSPFG